VYTKESLEAKGNFRFSQKCHWHTEKEEIAPEISISNGKNSVRMTQFFFFFIVVESEIMWSKCIKTWLLCKRVRYV
jgi:hypothetical protein